MRNTQLSINIRDATEGVISTLTDFLLLTLYDLVAISTVRTMYDANRAIDDAHRMLDEVNYQTIKKAFSQLSQKGLVKQTGKHSTLEFAITKAGLKRIEAFIPTYAVNRPWDGHIYLISYDIPSRYNRARDTLRQYIRRTGGALLQESLWINPYNPTLLLEKFASTRGIPGTMLISKLGQDGAIGDESLPDLIRRVYRLDNLSDQYTNFLSAYQSHSTAPPLRVRLDFMAILKNDPQLPFPLEPKDFPSKKAWERHKCITQKML